MYRKTRAFTLIELLVVIAIIAILAAILFPVLASSRESARQSACASNLKQVMTAFQMYIQDYGEKYPVLLYGSPTTQLPMGYKGYFRWPWAVRVYANTFDVFYCPSEYNNKGLRNNTEMYGYIFGLTPAWGYNNRFFSPGLDDLAPDATPFRGISNSEVGNASSTILLAESIYWPVENGALNINTKSSGFFRVLPPSEWKTTTTPLTELTYGFCWPRHKGHILNVGFSDSHVQAMTIGQLKDASLWGSR